MPIPKYLSNIEFNLSTLLSENNELNRDLKSKASKCYASNPEAWPNADQMGLDSSQYEAVQLVLQNKLALIQGYKLIIDLSKYYY